MPPHEQVASSYQQQHRYDSIETSSAEEQRLVNDDHSNKKNWQSTNDADDSERRSRRQTYIILGVIYTISLVAIVISTTHAPLFDWPSYGPKFAPAVQVVDSFSCPDVDPIQLLKESSAVEDVENGAVAADDARCSEIGLAILKDLGGNAIDSAVATALCLGVVNPAASGLGGGAFILTHVDNDVIRFGDEFNDRRENPYGDDFEGKVTEFIDCREVAPAAATWDMFENDHYVSYVSAYIISLSYLLGGYRRKVFLKLSDHGDAHASYICSKTNHHAYLTCIFLHFSIITYIYIGILERWKGNGRTRPAQRTQFDAFAQWSSSVFYPR